MNLEKLKEFFPNSEIVIMTKEEKKWWDYHNPFRTIRYKHAIEGDKDAKTKK